MDVNTGKKRGMGVFLLTSDVERVDIHTEAGHLGYVYSSL